MATNDRKNAGAATGPKTGLPEPALGANDSSDTFTDMPASPSGTDGSRDKGKKPEEKPAEDDRIDIASADDVDPDKDLPEDDTD